MVRHLYEVLCTHTHVNTLGGMCIPRQAPTQGGDVREPSDPPVEWPASKAAGKAGMPRAGRRGLLTTVVFSPQQGFEAAPQASASVCQGCRSPAQGLPTQSTSLPSLSSIVNHGSLGRGGGGGGGPAWPCSDLCLSGPGTPITVLNGPILALDADLDVYAVVTYQLLGAQSGLFDIDNSTGEASEQPCTACLAPCLPAGVGVSQLLDLGPPFQCLIWALDRDPIPHSPHLAAGLGYLGAMWEDPGGGLEDNTRDLLVYKL